MKRILLHGLGFVSNCYLALDEDGCGVVIDPSVAYASAIAQCGFVPKIRQILLTHPHFDHILALQDWRSATGAPVCVSEADSDFLSDPYKNGHAVFFGESTTYPEADQMLREGDRIPIGGEALTVWNTPGHTGGSLCFCGTDFVFTGDTLFADGGVGRTDLYGGSLVALQASLARLFTLPPATVIYPGHGRSSTLAEEILCHKTIL